MSWKHRYSQLGDTVVHWNCFNQIKQECKHANKRQTNKNFTTRMCVCVEAESLSVVWAALELTLQLSNYWSLWLSHLHMWITGLNHQVTGLGWREAKLLAQGHTAISHSCMAEPECSYVQVRLQKLPWGSMPKAQHGLVGRAAQPWPLWDLNVPTASGGLGQEVQHEVFLMKRELNGQGPASHNQAVVWGFCTEAERTCQSQRPRKMIRTKMWVPPFIVKNWRTSHLAGPGKTSLFLTWETEAQKSSSLS